MQPSSSEHAHKIMLSYSKIIWFTWIVLPLFALFDERVAFDFENNQYYLNDKCISVLGDLSENGVCKLVENCPKILQLITMRNNSYTICGYKGFKQIVCCPMEHEINLQDSNFTLSESVSCTVHGSDVIGVLKFQSDCEHFENNMSIKPICSHDICKDLICCPLVLSTRLKQVCSNVDMPSDMVTIRLHQNQPCVVHGTNITGRYQHKCDYATRNPHMELSLKNVCNDSSCDGWYCCPIEEPHDQYHCHNKVPLPNVKIVGPKCVDSRTGQMGRCRSIDDCYGYESNQLDKCGRYCCLEYYCCPDFIQEIDNQSLAVQKCWEYSKYVNKHEFEVPMNLYSNRTMCGSEILPVGGVVVVPGEYPHMAALGYELSEEITWRCGGSLISDEYILTAAHCLDRSKFGKLKIIRLGVIDLFNDIEVPDCPEDYPVLRTIRHPNHNASSIYNDIGLIQLDRKVKFNYHIRPICLPTSANLPSRYVSMGWGDLGPVHERSTKLIKVEQDFYSFEDCQNFYKNNLYRRNSGIRNDTQMCAGSKTDIQGTCVGDSGGPLLAILPGTDRVFVVYGIVSTGTVCGFTNTPGIYTTVFPYMEWIEGIVFADTK